VAWDRSGVKNPNWKGGFALKSRYIRHRALGHLRADSWGYVDEHILIAEKALGKPLPPKARVHHVDCNERNNEKRNLVICENHSYHQLLHLRTEALRRGALPGHLPTRWRAGIRLSEQVDRFLQEEAIA